MDVAGDRRSTGGMTTGMLIAGAVVVLALPSAVLAFSTRFDSPTGIRPAEPIGPATDAAPAGTLARALPLRSLAKGPLYPFTPAGTPNRPDRSVTVAVRVDPITVRGISVRPGRIAQADAAGATPLRIAPTAFELGVSRGYHNFAQNILPGTDVRKIEMPDLASFGTSGKSASPPGRFAPHISVDEKQTGRSPRTFAGDRDDQVDVGGSYRVTRNLNVTAGVRYSQDRERLKPLTDGSLDNQAVYVGTQFKF